MASWQSNQGCPKLRFMDYASNLKSLNIRTDEWKLLANDHKNGKLLYTVYRKKGKTAV